MTAVHQVVASLVPHDAVSAHTLRVRDLLRGMGLDSEIYATEAWGGMEHHARSLSEYPDPRSAAFVLYQFSTGSDAGEFALDRPEPLVLCSHNVTPASFFEPWDAPIAAELAQGSEQLDRLARRARLGIGVSAFNGADLRRRGCERVEVVPPLLDLDATTGEVDRLALDRLAGAREPGGADWLAVGRISPNKAQHELVKALALYRRLYDEQARLHLVGTSSSWHYQRALRRLVHELDLDQAVSMPGSVTVQELRAHYQSADVLVSASEHEGFGFPLVEAMAAGVPVVAVGEAAVPETVGDAGILIPARRPAVFAAAVHSVTDDLALRGRVVAAGARRAAEFAPDRIGPRLETLLRSVLADLDGGVAA